jgi:hypothetical protein
VSRGSEVFVGVSSQVCHGLTLTLKEAPSLIVGVAKPAGWTPFCQAVAKPAGLTLVLLWAESCPGPWRGRDPCRICHLYLLGARRWVWI